ncbi:MAG: hypothetical protein RR395_08280 [Ruthenibacterium sp.]
MRKSIRFFLSPVLQGVASLPVVALGLALYSAITCAAQDYVLAGMGATLIYVFAAPLLTLGIAINLTSIYLPLAVSMSSTRKANFMGLQVMKLISALLHLVAAGAALWLFHLVFGTMIPLSANAVILFFFAVLLTHTVGENLGFVCLRYGKIGMVVYLILCGLFGAVIGFFMVSRHNWLSIVSAIVNALLTNSFLLIGACLALTAALSAISGFLMRNLTVRD